MNQRKMFQKKKKIITRTISARRAYKTRIRKKYRVLNILNTHKPLAITMAGKKCFLFHLKLFDAPHNSILIFFRKKFNYTKYQGGHCPFKFFIGSDCPLPPLTPCTIRKISKDATTSPFPTKFSKCLVVTFSWYDIFIYSSNSRMKQRQQNNVDTRNTTNNV